MSILLNSLKAIKESSPIYWENFIHTHQIWIEYNRPTRDIDERHKKWEEYKINSIDFLHWNMFEFFLFLKLDLIYFHAWNLCEYLNFLCVWF